MNAIVNGRKHRKARESSVTAAARDNGSPGKADGNSGPQGTYAMEKPGAIRRQSTSKGFIPPSIQSIEKANAFHPNRALKRPHREDCKKEAAFWQMLISAAVILLKKFCIFSFAPANPKKVQWISPSGIMEVQTIFPLRQSFFPLCCTTKFFAAIGNEKKVSMLISAGLGEAASPSGRRRVPVGASPASSTFRTNASFVSGSKQHTS
jgi:hypothetical protein